MLPVHVRQYELKEVVASGGMGTVYRALDHNLARQVAIKLLKEDLASDQHVVESFYREARAMAALNHTNIIHVYAFEEYQGLPYIVMELADQGSLDARIEAEGALPEEDVIKVGIRVASALDTALKHELLHRDIKPGNILFNADGEPKLVDFGLARKAGDEEYEATIWGTPYYVAPEKVNRQGEDFLSDMYSLGGTLYHALTGHVPFEAETIEAVVLAHVHTALTPPNGVNPAVSQPTSDTIARTLAKNPAERYQSYDELIMDLTAAQSYLTVQKYGGQSRSWWKR
jgi:serine/threonine protein kinase